jgi:hypothetical protein
MAKLTQKQKEEVSRLTQADLRAIHTFHGGTIYVDGGRVAVPKPRAYGPVYGAAKEAAINWYVKSFLHGVLEAGGRLAKKPVEQLLRMGRKMSAYMIVR